MSLIAFNVRITSLWMSIKPLWAVLAISMAEPLPLRTLSSELIFKSDNSWCPMRPLLCDYPTDVHRQSFSHFRPLWIPYQGSAHLWTENFGWTNLKGCSLIKSSIQNVWWSCQICKRNHVVCNLCQASVIMGNLSCQSHWFLFLLLISTQVEDPNSQP